MASPPNTSAPNTSRQLLLADQMTRGRNMKSVRLSIEIGPASDTPAKRIAAAAAEKQRMAQEIITQDDYVQKLMRDFGAKIVPNSIHIT